MCNIHCTCIKCWETCICHCLPWENGYYQHTMYYNSTQLVDLKIMRNGHRILIFYKNITVNWDRIICKICVKKPNLCCPKLINSIAYNETNLKYGNCRQGSIFYSKLNFFKTYCLAFDTIYLKQNVFCFILICFTDKYCVSRKLTA